MDTMASELQQLQKDKKILEQQANVSVTLLYM